MTKFKPKNKTISDIYYRIVANLPITGFENLRDDFKNEWKLLEERIDEHYIEKKKFNKITGTIECQSLNEV